MDGVQFFDPKEDVSVAWRSLPHWAQAGTVCFITWRTADSLPSEVRERLKRERGEILRRIGIDADGDWKAELAKLTARERSQTQRQLFAAWDAMLDLGSGACVLARAELAQIVEENLLHFDGDRYELTDFVVMPNHVHVLVAFHREEMLLAQCRSWKRFTARRINSVLGQQGEFWQVEQFDHLVRGPDEFGHYRRYIADNPRRAGLPVGSYRLYSKGSA